MAVQRKKVVVIGDEACGKTCLLNAFAKRKYPPFFGPTLFDNYVADVEMDRKVIELDLLDTAGQEDFDQLRPLSYPDSDVILMCFSLDSLSSLENITTKWNPEVERFCNDGAPIIVVGNKKDLMQDLYHNGDFSDDQPEFVTHFQGYAAAQKIGAFAYVECSAKELNGVKDVFELVALTALVAQKKQKSICIII